MNKNKEVIVKLLIICSLYTVITGVTQIFHKDNEFNGDKFKVEKGKTKVVKVIKKDGYSNFMRIVNNEKTKLLKKQIAKKEKLRQQELKKELLAKQKIRETKIANEEKEVSDNVSKSRGGDYDTTFTCTFYSGLVEENSSEGDIGSQGVRLYDGCVASNVIPYGSKINLEGYGNMEVLDSGGDNFDSSNRLDIYVSRENGESDDDYSNRVMRMGKVKIRGSIVN